MKDKYINIKVEDLFSKIEVNIKEQEEIARIQEAYDFAKKVHEGEIRLNGDAVITHVIEVTNIVNDLNVDATTIIAAFIHEVLNDDRVHYKRLKKNLEVKLQLL